MQKDGAVEAAQISEHIQQQQFTSSMKLLTTQTSQTRIGRDMSPKQQSSGVSNEIALMYHATNKKPKLTDRKMTSNVEMEYCSNEQDENQLKEPNGSTNLSQAKEQRDAYKSFNKI